MYLLAFEPQSLNPGVEILGFVPGRGLLCTTVFGRSGPVRQRWGIRQENRILRRQKVSFWKRRSLSERLR